MAFLDEPTLEQACELLLVFDHEDAHVRILAPEMKVR